jgi:competence protein ComEC
MVASSILAGMLGRLPDPLTSLLLAATIMAAVEPGVLLELGFQLSFSATLGLVLLWPRLRRGLHRVPRPIAEPAGVTIAVTVATLPIALSAFGSVSLISPLAHVAAMPLLPPLLISTALLALCGWAPPLAYALGWLVALQAGVLAGIVHFFGDLPVAALSSGRLPPFGAAALAAALLVVALWQQPDMRAARAWLASKLGRYRWTLPPAACACGLAIALLVKPDGVLHVEQLAVEPGEAVFVRAPSGQTVLLARGKLNTRGLLDGVAANLSVLEHGLDVVVSMDEDADSGLAALQKTYPAERTLYAVDQRLDLASDTLLDVYSDGRAVLTSRESSIELLRSAPTTFAATPATPDRSRSR